MYSSRCIVLLFGYIHAQNFEYNETSRTDETDENQATKPSLPYEFPMMAAIVNMSTRMVTCGAAIISRHYALTAGHCILNKPITNLAVVVGTNNISALNDSTAAQLYGINSSSVHPNYGRYYDSDIAVIRTSGAVEFSASVQPVRLPFKYDAGYDFNGANVTMLGWDSSFRGAELRYTNMNVISQYKCRKSISTLTPRDICTVTKRNDQCQGTPGGPVLYKDPISSNMYLIGIHTVGKICKPGPIVNTRVTSYLPWIVKNTPRQK